ncbi:hypothetical protein ACVILH_002181 [Bradyrhizobium sp. USDA 4353]
MRSICSRLAMKPSDPQQGRSGFRALGSAASTSVSTSANACSDVDLGALNTTEGQFAVECCAGQSHPRSTYALHSGRLSGAGSDDKKARWSNDSDRAVATCGPRPDYARLHGERRKFALLPAPSLQQIQLVAEAVNGRSPADLSSDDEHCRNMSDAAQPAFLVAAKLPSCRTPLALVAANVLGLFRYRRFFSGPVWSTTRRANIRTNRAVESKPEGGELSGQDKSGSPVERQAIGMACVQPCRSVGARAALCTFSSEINVVFGTVVFPAALGRRA